MNEQYQPEGQAEERSNRTFWILVVIFVLPYVAAMTYYLAGDQLPGVSTSNRGELVTPVRPLGTLQFDTLAGDAVSIEDYSGKWVVLSVSGNVCEENCKHNLYSMRQTRKALANDRARVQRVMLFPGAADSLGPLLTEYEGTDIWHGPEGSTEQLTRILDPQGQGAQGWLYIVDPLGNLMMRYQPMTDPMDLLKDLQRLMKFSKAG